MQVFEVSKEGKFQCLFVEKADAEEYVDRHAQGKELWTINRVERVDVIWLNQESR